MPSPETEEPVVVSMPVPEHTPQPPPEPEVLPHAMDGALTELTPMQAQLDVGPTVKKLDKALDSMGEKITGLTSQTDRAMSVMNTVTTIVTAATQNDIAQKIERGIQRFADDLPWLMKALDEVARIHPVVTVAVLAFKAVYALESTRQENDRRVMTLYVEMKDMMMVMVQLKGVENRTHIGLDGRPLKDRLEELAEKTAKNIKECANFCDTFVKKRLLVKVFKGPVWAEKLTGYVKTFSDRKADFQFALAMHTANSVSDVKRQNYDIQAKLDAMLGLFNKFVTAEERKLALEIDAKGGYTKVRQDDDALKALIVLDDTIRPHGEDAPRDVLREKTTRNKVALALDELKVELREDVEYALEKNFDAFTGKFELQVDLLQVQLEKYIRAENDRVIGAVTDAIKQGPHMKIKDLELRKIWQDMGWRGNVKARLFVLTLQDHYRDLFDNATNAERPDTIANDEWALEYLGLNWLRPLMEAFDDDASGYVTITEVNKLMDMRPSSLTWSIPHWLAYWAVGWRLASTSYIKRIQSAIALMREARPTILPRNRVDIDWYFLHHWHEAFAATAGFRQEWYEDGLEERFQDYIKYEEDRIRGNLEKIKYNIDTPETVSLVVGSGRLEKCFLLLLCLILEHDLRIVRAATRIVVLREALTNMQTTIWHVFRAFDRRFVELTDLFAEQKVDRRERFKEFAFGLFFEVSPDSDLWATSKLEDGTFALFVPDDETPIVLDGIEEEKKPAIVSTSMLDEVDPETEDDRAAPDPAKPIIGEWNGFAYTEVIYPRRPMLSLHFHYSKKDGEDFCGSGVEFDGDTYTLSGTCSTAENGALKVKWDISYADGTAVHYDGTLVDDLTIAGIRMYGDDPEPDFSYILKKIPAPYMTLRPRPSVLAADKYRSLWRYAIEATIQDVRRRSWSWSYFAARRDVRRKYLEEHFRRKRFFVEEPEEEYNAGLNEARGLCTAVETRLYENICEHLYLTLPYHWYTLCEGAAEVNKHYIEGGRCICLTCVADKNDFSRQVSFCDDPDCLGARKSGGSWTTVYDTVHRTTHDILKVRTVINRLLWPSLSGRAATALELVRAPGILADPPGEKTEGGGISAEPSEPDAPEKPSDTLNGLPEAPVGDPDGRAEPPEPTATVAEEDPSTSTSTPKCRICREAVYMGRCWFCLDCFDYICDACDSKTLVACGSCHKPFPQPEWYYGFTPDDFLCPTCVGRGVKGPDPDASSTAVSRHVSTHPLVQCKPLVSDPPAEPGTEPKTTDSRLAKLEERIEQLQGQLVTLESKQEAMQALLLSRFTEALMKIPGTDGLGGQAA